MYIVLFNRMLYNMSTSNIILKDYKVEILKSVDTKTSENYVVYPCNKVSYFDILNAIHNSISIDLLSDVFANVKQLNKCSTESSFKLIGRSL